MAYAIKQVRANVWTQADAARYLGCSRKHMSLIMAGHVRKSVMVLIDPSSCAPAYQAPTRQTACPYCDTGNTWVKYEGTLDTMGRLTFHCPNCGRPAVG